MREFKVGDRVRVVKDNPRFRIGGNSGRFGKVFEGNYPSLHNNEIAVEYDNGGWDHYPPDCLELIEDQEPESDRPAYDTLRPGDKVTLTFECNVNSDYNIVNCEGDLFGDEDAYNTATSVTVERKRMDEPMELGAVVVDAKDDDVLVRAAKDSKYPWFSHNGDDFLNWDDIIDPQPYKAEA